MFESEEFYLQAIDAGMVTHFDHTPEIIDHLIDREGFRTEAAEFSSGNSFSSSTDEGLGDDCELIDFGHFPGTGEMVVPVYHLTFDSHVPKRW